MLSPPTRSTLVFGTSTSVRATSGLYCPESLLRGSLEHALSWAHGQGETGPALIRFGWACLREALRARGLEDSQVIGHRDWTLRSADGSPDQTWVAAVEAAQYVGPLVPSALATKPLGSLVQPLSISPAPRLRPFTDSLGELNPMQARAACSLRDNLLPITEGPPGTGKTGTLASTALACFLHTRSPSLICTYSHTAAETVLRRLVQLASQFGVGPDQLAYLRDYRTGPPDLQCFHAFTRAGPDTALSKWPGKAKNPYPNRVLADIASGHTAVVVTTAYWSDYLRTRGLGGEPSWLARFGLVLVDAASQATESQAAVALRGGAGWGTYGPMEWLQTARTAPQGWRPSTLQLERGLRQPHGPNDSPLGWLHGCPHCPDLLLPRPAIRHAHIRRCHLPAGAAVSPFQSVEVRPHQG